MSRPGVKGDGDEWFRGSSIFYAINYHKEVESHSGINQTRTELRARLKHHPCLATPKIRFSDLVASEGSPRTEIKSLRKLKGRFRKQFRR